MDLNRRKFLIGALWVASAPIIVKASNLMALPVRPPLIEPRMFEMWGYDEYGNPVREMVPELMGMADRASTMFHWREGPAESFDSEPLPVSLTPGPRNVYFIAKT